MRTYRALQSETGLVALWLLSLQDNICCFIKASWIELLENVLDIFIMIRIVTVTMRTTTFTSDLPVAFGPSGWQRRWCLKIIILPFRISSGKPVISGGHAGLRIKTSFGRIHLKERLFCKPGRGLLFFSLSIIWLIDSSIHVFT